jgi:hypothetical protein
VRGPAHWLNSDGYLDWATVQQWLHAVRHDHCGNRELRDVISSDHNDGVCHYIDWASIQGHSDGL